MIFSTIRSNYENGIIDKQSYQKSMFSEYSKLFEYMELVQSTSTLREIHISAEGVFITLENIDANGGKYFIDMSISQEDWRAVPVMAMNFGGFELDELYIVNKICKYISGNAEGIVLDIGANLGWYTINICKQFSNIVSYAFEPVKETWNRLSENIKLNHLENCFLYNLGLSNISREEQVFYNAEESGAASMMNIREDDATEIVNCSFMCLDEFVEKNRMHHIDFIKCDVEGAELLVYQGGIETIKKYTPVVFSEMLRKWAARFNYHPNQIIELFESLGYQCYVIEKEKLKPFGKVNEETKETNYFFLHKDKHKDLIKILTI